MTGGVGGALGAGATSVAAPHVIGFLLEQGVPLPAAQALTQLAAIGMGAGVGGTNGAAAGLNESSGNAVMIIPLIQVLVRTIIAAGPIAANQCLASQGCRDALYFGGAGALAMVVAIATPPPASNNTGNTTPSPNYGGPTTSPVAKPIDTSSPGKPADQPQPVTTTGGSPIATPLPGGNSTVTPISTPQGVGIVMSQNGANGGTPTGTPPVTHKPVDDLLSQANKPINESGLSQAVRAWDKHDTSRQGGTFNPLVGNNADKNEYVSNWVRNLLTNPQTIRTNLPGGGVEYRLPNGQGARFELNGGFNIVDPRRP